jgi:hypothetical protein
MSEYHSKTTFFEKSRLELIKLMKGVSTMSNKKFNKEHVNIKGDSMTIGMPSKIRNSTKKKLLPSSPKNMNQNKQKVVHYSYVGVSSSASPLMK